jgi:hypothetical protein
LRGDSAVLCVLKLVICKFIHNLNLVDIKDLDFGFGFLPVLSEMGEIREFRCFSVIQNLNLRTKFDQILNFQKKILKIPQIQ